MSKETTKAIRRRFKEHDAGIFPWRDILTGTVLDVGAGDDPVPGSVAFDVGNGDANRLADYFPVESFDVLHGSHCLEHMINPTAALRNWIKLVTPGGYIVQTVPDVGAYERFTYPSKFNADHRSSWSMVYKGSPFPIHCHIPTYLAQFNDVAEIKLMRYVEENYDWKLPPSVDQTWVPGRGTEIWNEMVLRKL